MRYGMLFTNPGWQIRYVFVCGEQKIWFDMTGQVDLPKVLTYLPVVLALPSHVQPVLCSSVFRTPK